jgi:hypothetical protein
MTPDINHILKVYLGTDDNGGYEPIYRDDIADGLSRALRRV